VVDGCKLLWQWGRRFSSSARFGLVPCCRARLVASQCLRCASCLSLKLSVSLRRLHQTQCPYSSNSLGARSSLLCSSERVRSSIFRSSGQTYRPVIERGTSMLFFGVTMMIPPWGCREFTSRPLSRVNRSALCFRLHKRCLELREKDGEGVPTMRHPVDWVIRRSPTRSGNPFK
jgi:hypothetical protein